MLKLILLVRNWDLSVIYKVFKQNEKHTCINKLCRFYVVSGGHPALLGLPVIKILGILNVKCNMIVTIKLTQGIN